MIDVLVPTLGFDHFSFFARKPVPVANPAVLIFDRYPAGWMDHYHRQSYLEQDPAIINGAKTTDVMRWSSEMFASAGELWSDIQDVGFPHGMAKSSWARHGSYALLSLARCNDVVSDAELNRLRLPVTWAASTIHARFDYLLDAQSLSGLDIRLSNREREMLLRTAEGRTAANIAELLGLSKRTVDFHIANASKKLNATSKPQAVVNAMGLGLIDPG
ncbi:transcriptional regulator RhlR [Salinisphaera aquimarina]